MSIKQIIQESINKNPLGLKEALEEELRARIALALEAKVAESEHDDEEEDEDEESEQIDEISKDTLRSYSMKAVPDFLKTHKAAEKLDMTAKNADKIAKAGIKLRNRSQGVERATKRMSEK
jgi:hypothetical protein